MEKMKEKHITQRPAISLWGHVVYIIVGCTMVDVIEIHLTFWSGLFVLLAVLIGVEIASVHINKFLFGTELILSSEGIETQGRIGRKLTSWSDFIQAGTLTWDYTNVLVLVRRGGRTMKERTPKRWFVYGNPGKLVFLPDDKFTRAYVAAFYGSIDFERAEKEEDE